MYKTHLEFIKLNTKGHTDIIDITSQLDPIIQNSKISNGSVLIFVAGATGALSTIEYEPGLLKDFPALMEKLIPQHQTYLHNETWGDGNGHSHLRATLMGPSLTIPLHEKKLLLGTWQQVIFLDFDNHPRNREIAVQVGGI